LLEVALLPLTTVDEGDVLLLKCQQRVGFGQVGDDRIGVLDRVAHDVRHARLTPAGVSFGVTVLACRRTDVLRRLRVKRCDHCRGEGEKQLSVHPAIMSGDIMTSRPFGWTGVQVPVIGQGTWMIEGSAEAERRSIQALRAGMDLGLTHIDSAEMYGSGRAEEITGKAIAGRRDEVFLVSKVLPSN